MSVQIVSKKGTVVPHYNAQLTNVIRYSNVEPDLIAKENSDRLIIAIIKLGCSS